MESQVALYEVKLATYAVTHKKRGYRLFFTLTTLTIPTIQASHASIHQYACFGITLFAELRTFWEAFVV